MKTRHWLWVVLMSFATTALASQVYYLPSNALAIQDVETLQEIAYAVQLNDQETLPNLLAQGKALNNLAGKKCLLLGQSHIRGLAWVKIEGKPGKWLIQSKHLWHPPADEPVPQLGGPERLPE